MAKMEAEHMPKIAIKELLKEGFLSGREAGWIRWHDPFVGHEHLFKISSVFIDEIEDLYPDDESRKMLPLEGVIEFESTVTGVPQGDSFRFSEQTMIVQSIALKTTPCNYGRRRFWFSCPGIGQKRCFARVGILYWLHGSLACRKCHNLAYKVQNIAKGERKFGRFVPAGEIEQMWKSLKKYSYKGKPTKRYLRVKKKTAEFNTALERAKVTPEKMAEVVEKETTSGKSEF
ncbi:MAG: hypothetical protein V4474_00655 [Patescibacteria group bacterium]